MSSTAFEPTNNSDNRFSLSKEKKHRRALILTLLLSLTAILALCLGGCRKGPKPPALFDDTLEKVDPDPDVHVRITAAGEPNIIYAPPVDVAGYRYGPTIMYYADGTSDAWFSTKGRAIEVFTDYGISELGAGISGLYSEHRFFEGMRRFIEIGSGYAEDWIAGEPFDNYEEVSAFLRAVHDPKGPDLSYRNITVSTCGLVPQIRRLAGEKLQITLALSLHAPNDALRRTMMPIANAYTVQETVAACDEYFTATGRRMSYEYSLIEGVNDSEACAKELAALLHGKNAHVNLIPVNPIRERDFRAPDRAAALRFQKRLENLGINATIRRKMGADIDSACGQLRLRTKAEQGG